MKVQQIQPTSSPLFLRLKIAGGYLLLILLFGSIVWIVWNEKQRMGTLNAGERTIQENRKIVSNTFAQLLDLSFSDDFLLTGDTAALTIYRTKRFRAVATLNKLKEYNPTTEQQCRIDSVCSLLEEKEIHLCKVMEALSAQDETIELVQHRIPRIASQAHEESIPVKKKGGILGLFRKKQAHTSPKDSLKAQTLLYSLGKEVHNKQQEQQELLAIYADSLQQKNILLNSKLNQIIRDFEADVTQRMEREYTAVIEQRERFFRIISLTLVMAVLLVIIFYILIHRDISQKHNYRKRLEAADRQKEELLNSRKNTMLTVSHDLRAPLTAINGYAELLPDEKKKENRLRYTEAILHSSGRMLSLLNSLLSYYRLDTGKEQPEECPFRLKSITDTLGAEHAPLAAKKRLEFSAEYTGDDVIVAGDRERILQIASNLLSNAVKFTSAGYVRMKLIYADGYLAISVEDTGAGMTDEQLKRIFQPFERLGNAETEEGFGLGLSITLALVELLDGKIEVNSRPGQGSTFTIHLPLSVCTEENLLSQNAGQENLPANLRVAVVDNDAVLLAMTLEMFSRFKVHADGFRHVKELMEQIRTNSYDLIITDIMMPDINGFGLLELLRTSNMEKTKTIPVLAMTARAERGTDEFIAAGFAGCVYKPFSRDELATAVSHCIGNQTKKQIPEADFSMLLAGEDNGKEMLELLAQETGKNMANLSGALTKRDRKVISELTHQLLPLWEVLRIEAPLKELRQALSVTDTIDETVQTAIQKVLAVGERLVMQAKDEEERI